MKSFEEYLKESVEEMGPRQISKLSFKSEDSEIQFSIIDEGWGPTLLITDNTSQNTIKIFTDKNSLGHLGNLIEEGIRTQFSPDHPNKSVAEFEEESLEEESLELTDTVPSEVPDLSGELDLEGEESPQDSELDLGSEETEEELDLSSEEGSSEELDLSGEGDLLNFDEWEN